MLRIHNTLSRKIEDFRPINDKNISLYTCGPTVYDYAHIGNFRAYIFGDLLKRSLTYLGYKVNHVMNITDIDDKTIKNSIEKKQTLKEFTEFYTEAFFLDRDSVNILPADKYTKATDYVKDMLLMIDDLIINEFAYVEEDGSVYFNIKKAKDYGKLSHFKLDSLKENAQGRLKKDEYDKENAQDFALWKAYDKSDGDIFWEPEKYLGKDTKIQKGRPGWHIECSTMSIANLGETIDIHTGGVDNIFPHHENEIAQSECFTGKTFVNYWMHNEHLLVDGKKMAKSAGNFYTLRDLEGKNISPLAFRMWLCTSHYRTLTNFSLEALEGANTALKRLYEAYNALGDAYDAVNEEYQSRFKGYLENDLDTSKALALVWEVLKDSSLSPACKKSTISDFDKVLGLKLDDQIKVEIPKQVFGLAKDREKARADKDWAESDRIRDEIKALGFEIKDVGNGFEIKKL